MMKEWAKKGAKDEISSYQILSHRERVVGHRWTVGAKRISNDLEWYSYMTYYIPLIFGISNMFMFNLTCGDDPIWEIFQLGSTTTKYTNRFYSLTPHRLESKRREAYRSISRLCRDLKVRR